MFIYNVTIKVDRSVDSEWVHWMKEEHMKQLLDTGLFFDCRLCRLLEQDDTEGSTYVAQYFCQALEQYHAYISEHSQRIREEGFRRFGDKFVAFRTLMEIL